MKKSGVVAACTVILGLVSGAMADIHFSVFGSQGIFLDQGLTTLLPQNSWYQIMWSSDQIYASGNSGVQVSDATKSSGQMYGSYGTGGDDYILMSGGVPEEGGFAATFPNGRFSDANVGGQTIRNGYVYGYVYQDNNPEVGDYYGRTPIYGDGGGSFWNDPDNALLPKNSVDFAEGAPLVLDTFQVVPEPGTLALFGLGALTLAARRKFRKAA